MRKNTALVAIVVANGLGLSYVASLVPTSGKIALACVFAFTASTIALTTKED